MADTGTGPRLRIRTPCEAVAAQSMAGYQTVGVLPEQHNRNPLLSLQFVGRLLLRYAARQLSSLLLNEPPRNTREDA